MAKITQIDGSHGWEAHAANCPDLTKKVNRRLTSNGWTADFDTDVAVWLDHCSDFLLLGNGPEMALGEIDYAVRIMPCAAKVLNKGTIPTYREYYKDAADAVVENLRDMGYTVPDSQIG